MDLRRARRPERVPHRHDADQDRSTCTSRYRLEARLEAYNAFNSVVWDKPDPNISSANFGKVTRKRLDGTGREIQIGMRFVF